MSGHNWPERGVFQSTDGADGYLYLHIKSRLLPDHNILLLSMLIKHSWHVHTDHDCSISAVVCPLHQRFSSHKSGISGQLDVFNDKDGADWITDEHCQRGGGNEYGLSRW